MPPAVCPRLCNWDLAWEGYLQEVLNPLHSLRLS